MDAVGEKLAVAEDAGFAQWLAQSGGSLVVSAYQAGKLLCIGHAGGQTRLLARNFDRPMGLDLRDGRLLLATREAVLSFADDPLLARHFDESSPGRYDAVYLPRLSHHLAGVDVHDVALTSGPAWVVATRFSCLAQLSDRHSFVPRWRPGFVSDLAPEDRCHLNGLAMIGEQPAFVTCLAASDTAQGWRAQRERGGLLIDVRSGEPLLRDLCMPHSPRWHEGHVWLLESGQGRLLRVGADGAAQTVCELDGYLRGLDFVGPYALVGMSKAREHAHFGGLPLQSRVPALRCGIAVIDTRSGRRVGVFELTAGCNELFDLRFVAGRPRVNVLNLQGQATRVAFTTPADGSWWAQAEAIARPPQT